MGFAKWFDMSANSDRAAGRVQKSAARLEVHFRVLNMSLKGYFMVDRLS